MVVLVTETFGYKDRIMEAGKADLRKTLLEQYKNGMEAYTLVR